MLIDSVTDIGPAPYGNIRIRSGAAYPTVPLVGLLFVHSTNGLVVYCHDSKWRKVARV